MTSPLRNALLVPCLFLKAGDPSSTGMRDPASLLISQLGLQAKLHPGKDQGQDLDQVWMDPSFLPAPRSSGVKVALIITDGDGKPLPTTDPTARTFIVGLLSGFNTSGAVLVSDAGWFGNGWEYPMTAHPNGVGRMLLNQVAQGFMVPDKVLSERAQRSLGEETEEATRHGQEVAAFGQEKADVLASERLMRLRLIEAARFRHELLGGMRPTKVEMLWSKERDEPLYQEALTRDAHRLEIAERDTSKMAAQAPWVLVASLQAQVGSQTILKGNTVVGTMILFQAGKPVLAAIHTNKMAGGTWGGGLGQALTGKWGGVAMTNGQKLGEALNGPPIKR